MRLMLKHSFHALGSFGRSSHELITLCTVLVSYHQVLLRKPVCLCEFHYIFQGIFETRKVLLMICEQQQRAVKLYFHCLVGFELCCLEILGGSAKWMGNYDVAMTQLT